ncbi:hypothetical protein M3Y94_01148700 [Aphelenchoides besseyi]|nr:hypothetical protein M3Y94_01148700 [Aphelenchoides besseyi]KAI6227942.1 hypothetical protein M3Y95_00569900 [Aphelenchoides besseyi]
MAIVTFILLLLIVAVDGLTDFTLSCQRGYKVSAIRRQNSVFQANKAGSLSIECQSIIDTDLESITCQTLTSTPQCNGQIEGCTGNQWLAGFHAYAIENSTNVVLLDPVCCTSPKVKLDAMGCASERINVAVKPFEHTILGNDLVYRGLQCWHQYNPNNTLVDLVWKMEICQMVPQNGAGNFLSPGNNCPLPCECSCGIDTCANGHEPIRVVHKHLNYDTCGCDCICRYECL